MYSACMLEIDEDRFGELVDQALDTIPEHLLAMMDNVAVIVADQGEDPGVLGLYDGIPLTERGDYGGLVLPDRIFIYRIPLCQMCSTEAELVHEVRVTVVHEIAHHFGIDDERLDELGWD